MRVRVDGLERGRAPSTRPGAWTGSVHGFWRRGRAPSTGPAVWTGSVRGPKTWTGSVHGFWGRGRIPSTGPGRGRAPSTGAGGVDGLRPRVLGRGRAWTGSVHGPGSIHGRGRALSTVSGAWTGSVHGSRAVDGARPRPSTRGRPRPSTRGRSEPVHAQDPWTEPVHKFTTQDSWTETAYNTVHFGVSWCRSTVYGLCNVVGKAVSVPSTNEKGQRAKVKSIKPMFYNMSYNMYNVT